MPNNPNNWVDLNEVLASFWRGDVPIGGVVMAAVMTSDSMTAPILSYASRITHDEIDGVRID